MLYLIRPNFRVEYETDLGRAELRLASEHGADLSKLDWKLSEELVYTEQLLMLALRRGVPCSSGLVLDGGDVYVLTHPAELYKTAADSLAALTRLRQADSYRITEEFLESQMPGWKAHGVENDRAVASGLQRSLQEAIQEAEELLSGPDDPGLRSHWQSIGGTLPA